MVRYYGGEHLGPSRFQAFTEAAQSVITHDPYNAFCRENQTPWPKTATEHRTGNPQLQGEGTAETATINSSAEAVGETHEMSQQNPTRGHATAAIRGRQPSGPTRPLSILRHPSQQMEDEWDKYYGTNYSKTEDWSAATPDTQALKDFAGSMQTLTSKLVT